MAGASDQPGSTTPPEVQDKKPHFQYNLHQGCGSLYLSVQCTLRQCRTMHSAQHLGRCTTAVACIV
eukprot:3928491-Rhodomonas_salina.1